MSKLSITMESALAQLQHWHANADTEYFPAGGCCNFTIVMPTTLYALERRGYLAVTVAPCPRCGGRGEGVITVARGDFHPDAVSRLGQLVDPRRRVEEQGK